MKITNEKIGEEGTPHRTREGVFDQKHDFLRIWQAGQGVESGGKR